MVRSEGALWVIWRHIIALFALVTFSGCSFFAPSMQTIHVTSSPEGAKVLAGGQPVGVTPTQFEAHRGDNLLIQVQKNGYQTQYRTTLRTLSSMGVLDVVGGCFLLLPFFGLLSSGAWKHDPDKYGIILEPEK
jgi:hypothetical protein